MYQLLLLQVPGESHPHFLTFYPLWARGLWQPINPACVILWMLYRPWRPEEQEDLRLSELGHNCKRWLPGDGADDHYGLSPFTGLRKHGSSKCKVMSLNMMVLLEIEILLILNGFLTACLENWQWANMCASLGYCWQPTTVRNSEQLHVVPSRLYFLGSLCVFTGFGKWLFWDTAFNFWVHLTVQYLSTVGALFSCFMEADWSKHHK